MILSFCHKGLEQFATKGDLSKIQQAPITKIRLILTPLQVATNPEQMNQPGYDFHVIKSDLKAFHLVKVSEN
jgi:proteic killer suppression protein